MSQAHYREHAAECVRRARETPNEEVKAMLLKLAKVWINLAAYVEALTSAPETGPQRGEPEAAGQVGAGLGNSVMPHGGPSANLSRRLRPR